MTHALPPQVRRGREELIRRVRRLNDPGEVFAEASRRLRRLVPHDSAGWGATDPGTGLPVAPTRMINIGEAEPDECVGFWRREYEVEDVNRFQDLARAEVPAAALRQIATDPEDSPRFREFLAPQGIDDELRVVFRAGGHPWAIASLWRRRGQGPFTDEEIRLAASLSRPLGETLRSHSRHTGDRSTSHSPERPGFLVFDRSASLVSVNEEARAWLDELPAEKAVPSDLGVDVPLWMMATVFRARAHANQPDFATARARVRTRRSIWLVCHGSVLRDQRGALSNIALMIEPAKAADVAPIVVQAYDLSDREQEITRLIARGASTGEIADRLYLSPHTVRDHVKAIFQKVRVSSRGELVGKLFADHYWPEHDRDVVRVEEP